jgi:hypothetical protein
VVLTRVIAPPPSGAHHTGAFAIPTAGTAIGTIRISPITGPTTPHHSGVHHTAVQMAAAPKSHAQIRVYLANPKNVVQVLLSQLAFGIGDFFL